MKTKKIFGFILVALILVGLMACGKKDIAGCWKPIKEEIEVEGTNQEAIERIKEYYNDDLSDENIKICFNNDGTFTAYENGKASDDNGTYSTNGNTLTISFGDDNDERVSLAIHISGSTLKLEQDFTENILSHYFLGIEDGDISKATRYTVFERIN